MVMSKHCQKVLKNERWMTHLRERGHPYRRYSSEMVELGPIPQIPRRDFILSYSKLNCNPFDDFILTTAVTIKSKMTLSDKILE